MAGKALAVLLAASVLAGGCHRDKKEAPASTTAASSTSTTVVERPRGGSVKVGVWGMPDPAAPTLAGAGVRSLVLPQLFRVGPDGKRVASLVEPGSDATDPDGRAASFRLRAGARWSNGAPITAADLRRTMDARVASVDEAGGRVVLRFKEPFADWRQLWSDTASVSPPADGVWGGPFVVSAMTPGLETVLKRNEQWWGGPGPWLDEVRLVLVPEATMQRQLFEQGELDVVQPPAYTNRRNQFHEVLKAGPGGWDVRLVMNTRRLSDGQREALIGAADSKVFVETLLADEAEAVGGRAADIGPLKGKTVQVSGEVEEPMGFFLQRAMQKRVTAAGGTLELRNAEADRVEGWVASGDYDAAVVMGYQTPEGCSSCRADMQVERLWRPLALVAIGGGVRGVEVNPWALTPAWNAAEWWRPASG